jgi:hypothetical protein
MTEERQDRESGINMGRITTVVAGWLVCQLFVSIWWASNVSTRLDTIEHSMEQTTEVTERLARVETQLTSLCETLASLRVELVELRKQVGYGSARQ